MKLVLVTIASAHEEWSELAEATYFKKIKPLFPFEVKALKPAKISREDKNLKIEQDSKVLLKELSHDDFIILFDERGKKLNSIQFSKELEKIFNGGKKRCVFIIGGAFGVSEELRQKAQLTISFSDMVFNHLIAQTVALEQIYRALTIQKNLPYHNQ